MDYAKEIKRLKKEKNAVVLAHNYQLPEVQDAADFTGDSLELSRKAAATGAEIIVFAGVDFMAETAKILSPRKKVLITSREAVCPMAAMLKPKDIENAKMLHPEAEVVLYVNSSAECKSMADCCCTSANAIEVVNAMESETVLFGPDRNLADYVQRHSRKKVVAVPAEGYCYVHGCIEKEGLLAMKELHPEAVIISHPECVPEVIDISDYVGSTSQMLRIAKESGKKEFIIATEKEMVYRLGKENPDKKFYPVQAICGQMKKTGIESVYNSLKNGEFEVEIPAEITEKAVKAINRMLEIK